MIRAILLSSLLMSASMSVSASLSAATANDGDAAELDVAPILVSERSVAALQAVRVETGGTSLSDVVESALRFAPQVIRAEALADAEEERITSALGAFDTRVNARYRGRMTGFYGGQSAGVEAVKRLETTNAEFYGGYRVSNGSLPIYEDEYLTNDGGEFKAGGRIALLRGRKIDPLRTALASARLGARRADLEAQVVNLNVQVSAGRAYVSWLYANRLLVIYRDLAAIAERRLKAVERAAAAGQLAQLDVEENRQVLLVRQNDVLSAEQTLAGAAATLSLFLRGQDGEPQLPRFGASSMVPEATVIDTLPLAEQVRQVTDTRPDFAALGLRRDALNLTVEQARNDQQAELALNYEVSRDIGGGSPTRAGTDHIVGLNFSLPLERRAATGALRKAEAEKRALAATLRLEEDRVEAALVANREQRVTSHAQRDVAERAEALARRLLEAEETRYLAGNSDFFNLNIQETVLATSALRRIDAQRRVETALVDILQITGQPWF